MSQLDPRRSYFIAGSDAGVCHFGKKLLFFPEALQFNRTLGQSLLSLREILASFYSWPLLPHRNQPVIALISPFSKLLGEKLPLKDYGAEIVMT